MQLPSRLIRHANSVPRVLRPLGRRDVRGPFDLFTDRARNVLSVAQEEAKRLGHNYIGTEHLLLGLLRERESVGGQILHGMGVELASVRSEMESVIGRGREQVVGETRLTPRAKRVLASAAKEAKGLRHDYVGTEHLLLGLIREGEGVAASILRGLGITGVKVRAEVERIVGRGR